MKRRPEILLNNIVKFPTKHDQLQNDIRDVLVRTFKLTPPIASELSMVIYKEADQAGDDGLRVVDKDSQMAALWLLCSIASAAYRLGKRDTGGNNAH